MRQARELIQQASRLLGSRLEAELLLADALGKDRAWLYAHATDSIESAAASRFQARVERRAGGEPIAYILGWREFYGRAFTVTPAVLIPRPETELLVELALEMALPERCRAVDVGTGSGCIALTLGAERPLWQISATDISPEALAVAKRNRETLGLPRVELLLGDLLSPVADQQFDLIVSNPPYVACGDPHLETGDLRFEPSLALDCADGGLELIRKLVVAAPGQLKAGGWLMIEHGHDQAASVSALFRQQGFDDVKSHRDLAGINRVTLGRWQFGQR